MRHSLLHVLLILAFCAQTLLLAWMPSAMAASQLSAAEAAVDAQAAMPCHAAQASAPQPAPDDGPCCAGDDCRCVVACGMSLLVVQRAVPALATAVDARPPFALALSPRPSPPPLLRPPIVH